MSPRARILLFVIFFFSGASALIYEVVWTRLLTLRFGVTAYAVATVVATFMAGLALGSWGLGRLADRWRHPLRVYALLEVIIGVLGLLVPVLLTASTALATAASAGAVGAGHAVLTFAGAAVVLLLPTTLMGGTLPLLARVITDDLGSAGRSIGSLYAVNTWGGVVGSGVSAFVLIALVGVTRTIHVAAGINLLLALATLLMARAGVGTLPLATPIARGPATASGAANAEPCSADASEGARVAGGAAASPVGTARSFPARSIAPTPLGLVALAYGASGAVALMIQVLLTRFAVFFLWDTTVYSFSTILTTFLAGLALGSSVTARLVDRWRGLLGAFGLLQIGVGLACLGALPFLETLTATRSQLWEGLYTTGELPMWRYLGVKFLLAAMLVLPPTLLMGAIFPVVSRIVSTHLSSLGRRVGSVYAANTLGAILGSGIAGFWLVPHVGIVRGILLAGSLSVLMGMGLVLAERGRSIAWRRGWTGAATAALAVALLAAPWGRTAVTYADLVSGDVSTREVLYEHEGREATLAVLVDPRTGIKELNINGQSTAFTSYMDLQVHRTLGHLPAFCHPDPDTALVIGFGFGSTCHSILTHGVDRLDCVELVAAERETAPLFADVNRGVLDDVRFRFLEGDGRHHVLVTDRRYDILSFNAIHPKLSASLYTVEFYELCRDRLTEDGVIAAWLPINFLSADEFRMLVRTFQTVFPHSTMWYVGPGHAVLVGTPERFVPSYARFVERVSHPRAALDLAASNLADPMELLALYVLDEERVRTFAGEGALNTDDRPHIEYGISFSTDEWYETLQGIYGLTMAEPPPLADATGPWGSADSVRATLARHVRARRHSMYGGIVQTIGLSARSPGMIQQGLDGYRKALEIVPESANTRRLLEDKERSFEALRAAALHASGEGASSLEP
jgi:spermidine synthase